MARKYKLHRNYAVIWYCKWDTSIQYVRDLTAWEARKYLRRVLDSPQISWAHKVKIVEPKPIIIEEGESNEVQ
jgi:hypothetical protein